MGAYQSKLQPRMTHFDLDNFWHDCKKKTIEQNAEYIRDQEEREAFRKEENDKNFKERFSHSSSLHLDFSTYHGTDFIKTIGEHILPRLNTISMRNCVNAPDRFEKFFRFNFPEKISNLNIFNAGLDLSDYNLTDIRAILSKRISNSLRLHGFTMSCYNLEQLLTMSYKLNKINFSGCKLNDNEDIILEEEYPNLEELNLEGVGLSKVNIEHIVDYLIYKRAALRLRYLNLYHEGMEDFLTQIEKKLRLHGYKGSFKTVGDFLAFLNFLSYTGELLSSGINTLGRWMCHLFRLIFYPITFLYRSVAGSS
ncbi:unnamed protein product [Moneuplotes crassus]|uniref:Uncharacterized protein n=1 Tax=Euplotes crassus TaxID=5936 RepID=A0AAD2CY82_EUPCR|nr:unnamed protein product [Moneuplotes crassus]